MIIKRNLLNIKEVAKILALDEQIDKIISLEKDMENFILKVVMIGEFSAGKTALVNSFLNKDILDENIVPETAIATELQFSTDEKIIIFDKDNKTKTTTFKNINNEIAENFYKYVYCLNNDNLRSIGDRVLVDMPGFNSGVKAHNDAVMQYIDEASIYLLVVDCEKGTLTKSSIEFLQEISTYAKNIAIIITKCDKITDKSIEEVKTNIKNMSDCIAPNIPIITTSKYDLDIFEKIKSIITMFNYDDIYNQIFTPQILKRAEILLNILNQKKDAIDLDDKEINKRITMCNKQKQNLDKSMQAELQILDMKIRNETKNNIINDVQQALSNNKEKIKVALESGNEAFGYTVNNILRQVLMTSMGKYIELTFEGFMVDCSNNLEMGQNIINTLQESKQLIGNLDSAIKKINTSSNIVGGVLTALAITTKFVSPILEVALVFGSKIIGGIIGVISKQNREDEINRKIEMEFIPQIMSQIDPEIETALIGIKNDTVEKIEENFRELMQAEIEMLESLEKEKIEKQNEKNKIIDNIQAQINTVEDIICKLEMGNNYE